MEIEWKLEWPLIPLGIGVSLIGCAVVGPLALLPAAAVGANEVYVAASKYRKDHKPFKLTINVEETGEQVVLDANKYTTVAKVKKEIEQRTGISISKQRLAYNNKECDSRNTLTDNGIEDALTIELQTKFDLKILDTSNMEVCTAHVYDSTEIRQLFKLMAEYKGCKGYYNTSDFSWKLYSYKVHNGVAYFLRLLAHDPIKDYVKHMSKEARKLVLVTEKSSASGTNILNDETLCRFVGRNQEDMFIEMVGLENLKVMDQIMSAVNR